MKASGGAGAVGKRRGENFDSFRREEIAHLLNTGGVGAVAVADQQSVGIEPEDISGFSGSGRGDGSENRDLQTLAKRSLARTFGETVRLTGTHYD